MSFINPLSPLRGSSFILNTTPKARAVGYGYSAPDGARHALKLVTRHSSLPLLSRLRVVRFHLLKILFERGLERSVQLYRLREVGLGEFLLPLLKT